MRTLAFGDIHACLDALICLWDEVDPQPEDKVIFLGDYVDRGPDSRGVIDFCMDLKQKDLDITFLCGNHEEKFVMSIRDKNDLKDWMENWGGDATVKCYGSFEAVPAEHWEFLRTILPYYETESHIYIHACLEPDVPLSLQLPFTILHRKFDFPRYPEPHQSGKIMICGHTAQKSHVPINIGYAVCIDTDPDRGGWLTCLHVESGKYWQTNQSGDLRTGDINK
jgi:serine/threonine protein phosphatase 1